MHVSACRLSADPAPGLMPRPPTLRCRVLAVIAEADTVLTGAEIAQRAGLPYRQVVFAINGLYNAGKIARQGRKFTARWCSVDAKPSPPPAFVLLEQFFRRRRG